VPRAFIGMMQQRATESCGTNATLCANYRGHRLVELNELGSADTFHVGRRSAPGRITMIDALIPRESERLALYHCVLIPFGRTGATILLGVPHRRKMWRSNVLMNAMH
jgi:hypothetical protein